MKHKFLVVFLAIVASFCMVFGFAACGETENSGNTGGGSQEQQQPGGNQGSGSQGGSQEKPEEPPAKETDFTFVQSGNGFSVTAYSGEAKRAVVPATHDGKPVTIIGEKAFYDCSNVTEISLPTSIKEIGEYAFGYCTSLQKITIPNATRVQNYAFRGCGSLTEISVPSDCIELGNGAFMGCASLKKLTLNGSTVTQETLADCTSVTDLTIASSVRTIENGCLADMTSLVHLTVAQIPLTLADLFGCTSVTIDSSEHEFLPDRTESRRVSANGTTYVIGVPVDGTDWFTAPFTVTSEGRVAHYMGGKVEPITWMTEIVTLYGVRVASYQKPKTALVKCYFVPQNFESVTVTDERLSTNSPKIEGFKVEILNKYPIKTFEVYEGNKTEFFPEKIYDEFRLHIVREDDVEEFSYLKKADLSEADRKALEQPGEHTVTINREGKTLQATLTILASSYEINYMLGLDGVTNENPTSYITDGEDVKLKNPVRSSYEFLGWYTEAEFQNKITEIKGNAHKSYTLYAKWQSVFYVNDGVITGLSYYGKQQTELVIDETINGEKITSIEEKAFYQNTKLQKITIPASVTSIGNSAFRGCSGLTSVIIGSGVTEIGDYAFYECSGLTGELKIPDSVTSIGNWAFDGCSRLTSVTIGSGVISIGERAFEDCSGLTSVTIPDSVTSIGALAFYGCSGLTSVMIGSGMTTIGERAFKGCEGLVSISIGSGSIGGYAFSGCSGLTSVKIGSGVTSIGSYAFCDCDGLTSVTIGSGVTSIGSSAFEDCSGLTSVTIGSGVTSIGVGAFSGCSNLEAISVATQNSSYSSQDGILYDKDKTEIVHVPHAIKGAITIPDSVTSIGAYAFYGCSGLTSVTIGSGVTSIGRQAFEHCRGLTKIQYNGTIDAWKQIEGNFWDPDTGDYTVYCTNGTITKDGKETYYNNAQNVSAYVAVTPRKREF